MTCLVADDGEKLPVFVVCLRRHCERPDNGGAVVCLVIGEEMEGLNWSFSLVLPLRGLGASSTLSLSGPALKCSGEGAG